MKPLKTVSAFFSIVSLLMLMGCGAKDEAASIPNAKPPDPALVKKYADIRKMMAEERARQAAGSGPGNAPQNPTGG